MKLNIYEYLIQLNLSRWHTILKISNFYDFHSLIKFFILKSFNLVEYIFKTFADLLFFPTIKQHIFN